MRRWYVLHTKPHAEYQVTRVLQQRGFETYLPEISHQVTRKWTPFFPCYLFMKVDLESSNPAAWRWTPGLRRLVAFDQRAAYLPESVIVTLRTRLDEMNARGGLPPHPFKPGDVVQVTDGPFQDLTAIFEGPTTPSQRVTILLAFLGQVTRMQIDSKDLVKASAEADQKTEPKRPPRTRGRRTRGRGRRIRQQAGQVQT